MKSIQAFMGHDHETLDDTFNQFRTTKSSDFEKARQLFSQFKTGLQRHIVWEEEILFPVFEKKTGMVDSGPTAVMRAEHREIKGYLEQIHDRILAKDINTEELEESLLRVLAAHNQKEEEILYPWIDNNLEPSERETLFTDMENLPTEKYAY